MTLLRPKQIKFTSENQLIVGSASGNGKTLNPGATGLWAIGGIGQD